MADVPDDAGASAGAPGSALLKRVSTPTLVVFQRNFPASA
jgi:hypothetical protein